MTDLITNAASVSVPTLLAIIALFGFIPGFCLRLIVLAYPSDDPRRKELVAELYVMSRLERPVWVAEQLEVALFEGVGRRIKNLFQSMRPVTQRAPRRRRDQPYKVVALTRPAGPHERGEGIVVLESRDESGRWHCVSAKGISPEIYAKMVKVHTENKTITLEEFESLHFGDLPS